MESGSQQQPRRVLIAGDMSDSYRMRAMLEQLPADAHGDVFVEAAVGMQVKRWPRPAGVGITWLVRDAAAMRLRRGVGRGELLAEALTAWAAEWVTCPGDLAACDLWIGCGLSPHVTRLRRALEGVSQQGQHVPDRCAEIERSNECARSERPAPHCDADRALVRASLESKEPRS